LGSREAALVAEFDGASLGFSMIRAYSERAGYAPACETSTYLRPDARRRGLGTELKRRTIERCRASGYHHLVAKVLSTNESSIEYNLRLGYEIVGVQRQVGFRDNRWIDITLMQLILEDVPPYVANLQEARTFRRRQLRGRLVRRT
jgi:phosphinothricin acetyltransferase